MRIYDWQPPGLWAPNNGMQLVALHAAADGERERPLSAASNSRYGPSATLVGSTPVLALTIRNRQASRAPTGQQAAPDAMKY
jgi:hypothetical protein